MNFIAFFIISIIATYCSHELNQNTPIMLDALRTPSAPDYFYSDHNYRYVINFCGPTYMPCNGTFGGNFIKFDKCKHMISYWSMFTNISKLRTKSKLY